MDRHEAESMIAAFVDGEMSEKTAEDLERYIAGDADCAQKIEALQEFRTALKESTPQLEAPPYLRSRIEHLASTVAPETRGQSWSIERTIGWAAAAVLVAVVVWSFYSGNNPSLSLFVLDHLDYSVPGIGVEHSTANAGELSDWFSKRLPFFPRIPSLSAQLEGGRRCHIGEVQVALAFYLRDGKRLSLFVGPEKSLDRKTPILKFSVADSDLSLEKERGHSVATWNESGLTYVLVSSLDESTVRVMVENWRNESESS